MRTYFFGAKELRSLPVVAAAVSLTLACSGGGGGGSDLTSASTETVKNRKAHSTSSTNPVSIDVFAPGDGDRAGVGGVGWFVDIDLEFPGNLKSTGFTGNQLTGPGVHNNAAPFPGVFAPGRDEKFQGLVVLFSTTAFGALSCQNVANLFNLTGPTNVTDKAGTEIWDTWIITAPNFGRQTNSILYVAEVNDLNHDGIYNDAPDVVPDANHDGKCDETDLQALGLASDIEIVHFFIR